MRRSALLMPAALAAVALSLTACGGGGSAGSSSATGSAPAGVTLKTAGKFTVCSDIPYKPFEFTENGKNVGFDMDLGQAVAEKLGAELNVITAPFESIQSGQFVNQCDAAISGISITDARKANMDFSTPYLDDDLVLVAKDGNGVTDLASAKGKKVGVQSDTTGSEYAKKEGIDAVQFQTGELQVQSLISGTSDASIGNQSILRYGIKDHAEYKVVQEIPTGEKLGIAVKKGDAALLKVVDETLAGMDKDGKMAELKKKWFGEDAK